MSRDLKWWGLADFDSSSDSECTQEAAECEEKDCKTSAPFSLTEAPQGVSGPSWNKFQELRERRQKYAIQRPIRKRRRKKNARTKSDNLSVVMTTSEECEECCVDDNTHGDRTDDGSKNKLAHTETQTKLPTSKRCCLPDETEQKWTEIKKYIDINSHLNGVDPGRHAPKTGLEKLIDKAVEVGEFELAEEYSQQLAARNFAVKVSKAFDCVEYVKQKSEEMERRDKKRKRKLRWGFDGKHHWETKSNM